MHPQIASLMDPDDFCVFITNPRLPFHVPRICFADLDLKELADNPECGRADDLPYPHVAHLRDCLMQIGRPGGPPTKTVDRTTSSEFPYRLVGDGFWLGDAQGVLHYPFPTRERLDREYHDWWRSANA